MSDPDEDFEVRARALWEARREDVLEPATDEALEPDREPEDAEVPASFREPTPPFAPVVADRADVYRVYVAGAVIADRSPGPAGMGLVIVRGPERTTHHEALGILDAHVAVVRAATWALTLLMGARAPVWVVTNHPGLVKALRVPKAKRAPVVRDLFGGAVTGEVPKRVSTPYGAALGTLAIQLAVREVAGVVLSPNKAGDPEMVVARSMAALGAEISNDRLTQEAVKRALARRREPQGGGW